MHNWKLVPGGSRCVCRWISVKRVLLFGLFFQRQREVDASLGSSEDFEWQPRPLRDVPLKSILSVSITGRLSPFVNRSGSGVGQPGAATPVPNEPVAISSNSNCGFIGGEERRPIFRGSSPLHPLPPPSSPPSRGRDTCSFQKQTCEHRRKFITTTESAHARARAVRFSLTTSYKVFTRCCLVRNGASRCPDLLVSATFNCAPVNRSFAVRSLTNYPFPSILSLSFSIHKWTR